MTIEMLISVGAPIIILFLFMNGMNSEVMKNLTDKRKIFKEEDIRRIVKDEVEKIQRENNLPPHP